MVDICEFEVLFSGLLPAVPLPLVAQGFFLQVTNNSTVARAFTLTYRETSGFRNAQLDFAGMKLDLLTANYVDDMGEAHLVPTAQFLRDKGFSKIGIPPGKTFVFGLQAFPTPAISLPAAHPAHSSDPRRFVAPAGLPEFGIQWHGYVQVTAEKSTLTTPRTIYVYPTTRGVFFDPIVETTVDQASDVVTLGLTVGQTYSAVPTFSGKAVYSLA